MGPAVRALRQITDVSAPLGRGVGSPGRHTCSPPPGLCPTSCRLRPQSTMLQAIERYMKQAIVDKVPSVSSSAPRVFAGVASGQGLGLGLGWAGGGAGVGRPGWGGAGPGLGWSGLGLGLGLGCK